MSDLFGQRERVQTNVTQLDPTLRPFVQYGLEESLRQYQGGAPQYFPGATYVGPSAESEQALLAQRNRAIQGSPLNLAAQQQQLGTIGGQYLGGNPFFQGAFQPAAMAATQQFNQAIQDVSSQASRAGRYGSGAMGQLQDRASMQLANALTGTAGRLAYENYATERAAQERAAAGAPGLAATDYGDIAQLAAAGQGREAYEAQRLQDEINRFNYYQNLPQQQLSNFLSAAYGAPGGSVQRTPVYSSPLISGLGGAALGSQIGGTRYGTAGAILGGLAGLLGA
jgi:hypothetical protein